MDFIGYCQGNDPANALRMLERLDGAAPLDFRDARGRTALHWAAHWGQIELGRALLERGARIDAVDHDTNTPLALANAQGQRRMCLLLLACGADGVAAKAGASPATTNRKRPVKKVFLTGRSCLDLTRLQAAVQLRDVELIDKVIASNGPKSNYTVIEALRLAAQIADVDGCFEGAEFARARIAGMNSQSNAAAESASDRRSVKSRERPAADRIANRADNGPGLSAEVDGAISAPHPSDDQGPPSQPGDLVLWAANATASPAFSAPASFIAALMGGARRRNKPGEQTDASPDKSFNSF